MRSGAVLWIGMWLAGLWLELEICIGFVVGVGLGSLMGQRTVPILVLIVLDIIITPILADHAVPYHT